MRQHLIGIGTTDDDSRKHKKQIIFFNLSFAKSCGWDSNFYLYRLELLHKRWKWWILLNVSFECCLWSPKWWITTVSKTKESQNSSSKYKISTFLWIHSHCTHCTKKFETKFCYTIKMLQIFHECNAAQKNWM